MYVLLSLLYLGGYIITTMAIGCAIFSPIRHVISHAPLPGNRVQTIDMFALPIPLQIGLALLSQSESVRWNVYSFSMAFVVLSAISVVIWCYGQRILRRTTVVDWRKRLAMLGVVMPLGLITATTVGPLSIASVFNGNPTYTVLVSVAIVLFLRFTVIWAVAHKENISIADAG